MVSPQWRYWVRGPVIRLSTTLLVSKWFASREPQAGALWMKLGLPFSLNPPLVLRQSAGVIRCYWSGGHQAAGSGCFGLWRVTMGTLMGKTSGVLGSRWWSRSAICVAFTIWPLSWPGGWRRSQIMVDFMSSRSPKQCTPAVGAGQNVIPQCREDTHAERGGAAWAPLAVS